MSEPTPQLVRDFWAYMTFTFGSRVVRKADSSFMAFVADTLSLLGVQKKEDFLEQFATTIGSTIYVPFELGGAHPTFSLWRQITTCAHEHQHVQQFKDEDVGFAAKYLVSGPQRAAYEAEAYRVNMTLDWWRYKQMRSPDEQASRLKAYGCSGADIASAAQIITLSQETIRYGGVIGPVNKIALDWLNEHAPDLRENLTA